MNCVNNCKRAAVIHAMDGSQSIMVGSDLVRLPRREGYPTWEAAGDKRSKKRGHFCLVLCKETMCWHYARCQGFACGPQLWPYVRITWGQWGHLKKNLCLSQVLRDSD